MKQILLTAVLCLVAALSGCQSPRSVKVQVTGSSISSASVSEVLLTEGRETKSSLSVSLPWTHEFKARKGDGIAVSAIGQGAGSVSVSVYVDGIPVKQETSTGISPEASAGSKL